MVYPLTLSFSEDSVLLAHNSSKLLLKLCSLIHQLLPHILLLLTKSKTNVIKPWNQCINMTDCWGYRESWNYHKNIFIQFPVMLCSLCSVCLHIDTCISLQEKVDAGVININIPCKFSDEVCYPLFIFFTQVFQWCFACSCWCGTDITLMKNQRTHTCRYQMNSLLYFLCHDEFTF